MCGISGIYHPHHDSSSGWMGVVENMTRTLFHRGPDEDGYFWASRVSFGMRRLKVMDLKAGTQPISNEDGTVHAVYNGEIYNFEAIREKLENKGHVFKTQADTEVLVHLYEEYGLQCFDHFDGMFAFALWDSKLERLIVARDRFGIKPLFYTTPNADGRFAFASELQALFSFPGWSRTLDPIGIDKYLTLSYIPHPFSIFQEAKKISPGCYLLVQGNSVKEVPYWDLESQLNSVDTPSSLEELDDAISSAVKKMMRSDVPLGAFLSGGLDSSTIVYYMARHTNHPIQTFSVRFREEFFDEGENARAVSEILGTNHHEIWGRHEDIKLIPQLSQYFGEPFADASQIPTYLVSGLARQKVTVALSGDGGDEILGGYETYLASLLAEKGKFIPEFARRGLLRMASQIPVTLKHAGPDYKIPKFLLGVHLPPLESHAMWRTIFDSSQRRNLYDQEFLAELKGHNERPVFEKWASFFEGDKFENLTKYQLLDIKTYLTDNNLAKVDRMSMAHSLEVRVPFLDLGVVTTSLRLPAKLRVNGFQTKVSLRKLMRGRLPECVLRMKKKGFAVPLSMWFRGPLKGYLLETLSPERLEPLGFIRPQYVQDLLTLHIQGKSSFSRQLWNLICLVQWHDQVLKAGRV